MKPRPGPTLHAARARAPVPLALASLLIWLLYALPGGAQRVAVPAELQAELFAKVAAYDRNFGSRAGSNALVMLVVKDGDAKSSLFASSMKSALGRLERVGGLPHRENVVKYESPAKIAALVRSERAAAIFFSPGLNSELDTLKTALNGVDVLSVSAVPESVPKGSAVLGFDLVSGKPKILVNLEQANKQNVKFRADVLKLMKVYR
jgi:hypothetical protein